MTGRPLHLEPCRDRGQTPIATGDRLGGDRGSGLVAGIVLIFAFTFLGMVWLAHHVDRGVSNRSAAQSIAFQSARAGAQQVDVDSLRNGGGDRVEIDDRLSRSAADRSNRVGGNIQISASSPD